jgi:hypothetical protein
MPTALLFEGKLNGAWKTLAVQRFGMPPATFTDISQGTREVYVTQVFPEHATISRLRGGLDIEQGIGRIIDEAELQNAELIQHLEIGETIELGLQPTYAKAAREVRYRCVKLP